MKLRFKGYILRRLLSALPTLLGLSIIIFYTAMLLPPEERVNLFLSTQRYQNPWGPDEIPALIEKYGLNDPFPIQYARWLGGVMRGSLGWSYLYQTPVALLISRFFPATLEIVIYAAPIVFVGGYKLGVFSAKHGTSKSSRGNFVDFGVRSITTIGYAIPSFCMGIMLLLIFYAGMGLFPPGRLGEAANVFVRSSVFVRYTRINTVDALLNGQFWIFVDAVRHLVLPVVTLSVSMLAIVVRITRSSMIGELVKPYVVTARAKGLDEGGVMNHAKKNSLISVFTVSGILFASMLTGVIVTEYIFSIRGVGFLVVTAARRHDFPLLVGLSLLFCAIFTLVNLVVDVAYAYIDPRVKQ